MMDQKKLFKIREDYCKELIADLEKELALSNPGIEELEFIVSDHEQGSIEGVSLEVVSRLNSLIAKANEYIDKYYE